MAYYSVEPWDLPNQVLKSFLQKKTSRDVGDPDEALEDWARAHNAKLATLGKLRDA